MRALSRVLVFFCVLNLVCWFSFSATAQQSEPPAQVPPLAERHPAPAPGPDRLITLDVVVTDKSGNQVTGLQQQDFTILDDKQPQTIASFRAADGSQADDPPQQVIFLIDAVNNSFQGVELQRQQLEKYLRANAGPLPLPMSVVFLNDTSTMVQPTTTRDVNVILSALDENKQGLRTVTRSQGFYGAVDRIQISLKALEGLIAHEATQPGRKLMVWLSAGWPLLSGPNVELSEKDRQMIFQTIVRLSGNMRGARVTLYSVDSLGMDDALSRSFYYESFMKGVGTANQVQSGNLGLQVLAAQSGGQVLNRTNDVAKSIGSSVADAKAYYTITFNSPPADHPNEYHSLQVKIDKAKLVARTRTGYYAQP
jgi:VWFA-related protein